MTSEAFDLATLKSWHDAFEYPLGTTRQIEHGLRAEIASNKDRLRTLVGASYRDLLSTAERITYLDGSIQKTEVSMSTLSHNCNSDTLEKKAREVARVKQEQTDERSENRAIAAQVLLLQKCRSCVTRLLRDHDSSLLAAKVLSISRLLLKTLSQAGFLVPVLDSLRTQLASLRRHLLRRLDQRLSSLNSSQEQLVEAICAFCLATSSSSSDALRHYHHLRLQEIHRVLELGASEHQNIVQALRYYTKSLQTTKTLLGRSLSEALRNLGAQSIFRDRAVNQLDELDLNTLQRWVAVEIQDFVPFIKHTDLKGSEAKSPFHGWSRDAFDSFIEALKQSVQSVGNTSALLSLRRSLLEMWLPVCISTPVHSRSEILYLLRDVLNRRMGDLISIETESLTEIAIAIASTIDDNPAKRKADSSIWEENFVTVPVGKGATAFKQQLRMRHVGVMENISTTLSSLDTWIAKSKATGEVIEQLRKDRWQDLVEEDEEDDEAADRIETVLQRDDPKLYESEQVSGVARALTDFQLKIRDTADQVGERTTCERVQSLLRIMRETGLRLSQAFPNADLTTLETITPSLHNRLANDITINLRISSVKFTARHSSEKEIVHLWEGVPPLPMQPSPRIFRLLYKLNEIMADLGADLWSHAAVGAVKKTVSEHLVEHDFFHLNVRKVDGRDINGLTNGTSMTNGDSASEGPSVNPSRIQDVFDVSYLDCALATQPGDGVVPLRGVVGELVTLSELEDTDAKRVRRKAKDYWARTSLLFGLIA